MSPDLFLGRDRELSVLGELLASDQAELFVLYGRRRVGKTELLQRFCSSGRAVYFLAAQVREKDNLRAFQAALFEGLGEPPNALASVQLPDWSTALALAADLAGDQRLVLVLDEFPYLCDSSKGLPSQVQRFWDTLGKRSKIMLVLCGSQVSFMEKEVLAERSPLFGRRTGQLRLLPLQPKDCLAFFERWPLRQRILAYSILGGMPAYLRRFDDRRSLTDNLLREILRPEGYLFDEVSFLLRSDLNNPTTYNSILAAVARGNERLGDIALSVGVDSPTAGKYLSVLRELRLVEREVPITDPDPLRSRRGRWRIADRFLAFHFRHLQPNLSLVHAGRGAKVLEDFVSPDFGRLYDEGRRDLVLAHLAREAAELAGSEVVECGRYEGKLVRAIGRTADGRTLAAIVPPDTASGAGAPGRKPRLPSARLEAEIADLEKVFGPGIERLVYTVTEDAAAPLAVTQLPAEGNETPPPRSRSSGA